MMSLMLADIPSPAVHLGQLVTGWQLRDPYAVAAFAFQLIALMLYGWGLRRLRKKGRRWSPRRSSAFVAGVVVLNVALVSGLASYDDQVFTIHVIQHLALMMLAPPILALGAPITLAMQAANRRLHTNTIRALHSPIIGILTAPLVAGALYYGSMYVDFLTPFYRYSIEHDLVHNATHLLMFTFGCLFWWPMIGGDRVPKEPSFQIKVIAMLVGLALEVILGVALILRSATVAPAHTLSDTHGGGVAFLVGSALISIAASIVMIVQWARKRSRQSLRIAALQLPTPD
jgi:putative copper resistance protein D